MENGPKKGIVYTCDVMKGEIKAEDDQIFEFDPSSYKELRFGDLVAFNTDIRHIYNCGLGGVLKEAWLIRKI